MKREEQYYCLDIQFRNIDLDRYYYLPGPKPCHAIHHAHLYLRKEEIELRILYEPDTLFGTKIQTWLMTIDPVKFGSYLKVEVSNKSQKHLLQSVDFSDSGLTRSRNGLWSNVIQFELNSVKLYKVRQKGNASHTRSSSGKSPHFTFILISNTGFQKST